MKTLKTIITEEVDKLLGGKAANMSVEDLAKKHKCSIEKIKNQLKKGQKVELEHTKDSSLAYEIAKDHVYELVDYYDRLEKMEK